MCLAAHGAEERDARHGIREAILNRQSGEAIELLRREVPGLLAARPDLAFRLQQQRVLDAAASGDWDGALDLACRELAPLASARPGLSAALQDTMLIFAFPAAAVPDVCFAGPVRDAAAALGAETAPSGPPPACLDPSSAGGMLSGSHRSATAAAVNAAVLEARCQSSSSRLDALLASLPAAEERLQGGCLVTAPRLSAGAAAARGGLPDGDWVEAEELARLEADVLAGRAAHPPPGSVP